MSGVASSASSSDSDAASKPVSSKLKLMSSNDRGLVSLGSMVTLVVEQWCSDGEASLFSYLSPGGTISTPEAELPDAMRRRLVLVTWFLSPQHVKASVKCASW